MKKIINISEDSITVLEASNRFCNGKIIFYNYADQIYSLVRAGEGYYWVEIATMKAANGPYLNLEQALECLMNGLNAYCGNIHDLAEAIENTVPKPLFDD